LSANQPHRHYGQPLAAESKQQSSGFKNALKNLYLNNPELEPQITTYLERIEEGFEELPFNEPTIIPDVFLKEFDNPR